MQFTLDELNQGIEIYNQLPRKTKSNNVIIKNIYGIDGCTYARSISGVFTLRLFHTKNHFGNPYSSVLHVLDKNKDMIRCNSTTESVCKYITWVLYSPDERAVWIRSVLESGILKGKPLVYYKELDQPSHANGLDYLINVYFKS